MAGVLGWFDPAAPLRPSWWRPGFGLVLLAAAVITGVAWAVARWPALRDPEPSPTGESTRSRRLTLAVVVIALTVAFRLPLLWHGAAGYVTPDGALSGIVMLHLLDGSERLVFVPNVPYSGSLKSHLAALVSLAVEPVRAFALASLAFYALFAAAVVRLDRRPEVAGPAGLFVAFAPVFVTRYSLSNDGNYVEVLALGTWALVAAIRFGAPGDERRRVLAWVIGLLLGLAAWAHILAVMHVAAIGLFLLVTVPAAAVRQVPRIAAGGALGYLPGVVWNLAHGGESLLYVLPGGRPVGALEQGPGLLGRASEMVRSQWPVLMGYDVGYPQPWDEMLFTVSVAALGLAAVGLARGAKAAIADHDRTAGALVVLTLTCLAIALAALPVIEGNPRYLLFVAASLPVLMAQVRATPARVLLGAIIAVNAVASMAQAIPTIRSDRNFRRFVADLEAAGVRHCTTDFFLATKINFVSGERVVCSSELGPTTTEYFTAYRDAVARADRVAFVAVNGAAADKLERRLGRIGVGYRRLDLMKPVLVPARRVEVGELFPARPYPSASPSGSSEDR